MIIEFEYEGPAGVVWLVEAALSGAAASHDPWSPENEAETEILHVRNDADEDVSGQLPADILDDMKRAAVDTLVRRIDDGEFLPDHDGKDWDDV